MTETLFSPHWHRVAELRPRLRTQVSVQRRTWRGQRWYLLCDDATGQQHLVNEAAYQFVGRCNGLHSVQRVWDALFHERPDTALTQPEVVELLAKLDELELLQYERGADLGTLFQRRDERRRRRRRSMINPFAFRLSLGDPSAWLNRLDPLAHALFARSWLWTWAGAVALGLLLAAMQAGELAAHARELMSRPHSLALLWVCFPAIKALHELGHALAVRRWGGEVREFGLGLLVLLPAPYVDASAATAFASRRQRVAVAAAGIVVETSLAMLALLVWLAVQPGLVRDVAFVVMTIGGLSTVLFNANPLLRFDGYHMLCDALDLQNLAQRSNAWWGAVVRRRALGLSAPPPQVGRGELKWLVAYAPVSLCYRVAISVAIVLWLGSKTVLLGMATAAYLAAATLLLPLLRLARQALAAAALGRERRRVQLGLVVLVLVPGALLFVVPAPLTTLAPAVVWLPDEAQVRAEVDGFIARTVAADGSQVRTGDLLLVLDNPPLRSAREQLARRLDGLQAEQYRLLATDPGAAHNAAQRAASVEQELAHADARLAALRIHARSTGTLVMPRQSDLIGGFAARGATLGHVLAPGSLRVRAVVPQDDADLVRRHTRAAAARLADAPWRALPARVAQDIPAASNELPSAALGDRGGGPYATDPSEASGRRTLEPVFVVDLTVPGVPLERVGGRAWVRFDHGTEPLGTQALRRATQLFLRHFDPSA